MTQPPENPYLTPPQPHQGGYGGTHPGYPGYPGHPGHPGPPSLYPTTQSTNGVAIASLVLGALAVACCWVPVVNLLAIVLGVLGAALGLGGLVSARRTGGGRGLALSGIVLSVAAIVLALVINVLLARWLGSVGDALDGTPPPASAAVGDRVTEGTLEFTVTEPPSCVTTDEGSGVRTCRFAFLVVNEGLGSVTITPRNLAAVVDDDFEPVRITGSGVVPARAGESVAGEAELFLAEGADLTGIAVSDSSADGYGSSVISVP